LGTFFRTETKLIPFFPKKIDETILTQFF